MFSRFRSFILGQARHLRTTAGRKWLRDCAVLAIGLCVNAVLISFDAIGSLFAFTRRYEGSQLDDILTTVLVIGAAALCIAVLRMRDIRREAARRAGGEELVVEALHTMREGMALFDADERLVICNRRYAEIYDLPAELAQPGAELKHILEAQRHLAIAGQLSPEAYREELRASPRAGGGYAAMHEFKDGRCIQIVYEPRAAGGWLSIHDDVTERCRMERRLTYLSHHDALTGLANRVLLRERLATAIGAIKAGESVAVLCLDLDNFKTVNDALGHPAGDELLKQASARLLSCVRETDVVARMGGDEFVVLQLGSGQSTSAASLATRILDALGKSYEIGGHKAASGTSIGISIAPMDGVDPDQLLKNADLALYRAKGDGRGMCRFFERGMERQVHRRRQLELDLHEALGRGEFELHYQPILDLSSNEVRGLEALIRWNHPTDGRISPAEFIPLAEETGLIVSIGEWVLRQACSEGARWPEHVEIAVNVSPIQIRSGGLVKTVFSALTAAGMSPHRLELEITETILLQDSEATLATLHQLRALGVRIAMDDFGTGYSSLSYFRSFPFDKIKIDRSFVQGLTEGRSSLAILRAIASLAANLNMTTTVEGVETVEQLEKVREEGITQVQGFLVSPPRPAAELEGLIRRQPKEGRLAG
jgi:diguanylate cyclase (GGDEF)-like protein